MNRVLRFASVLTLLFAVRSPAVHAQVKVGDVITKLNADRISGLLSPGNYRLVRQGMSMDIVPTKSYQWPPPYKIATEKYSPQVRLDKGGNLKNYLAGLPFPLLDANDPEIAQKVMWNFQFNPTYIDDLDSKDDEIVCMAPGGKGEYESFPVGNLAVYRNVGRTEIKPIPTDTDGDTGIMERFAMGAIIVPIEPPFWQLPWTSFVEYRYSSASRGDLVWNGDDAWVAGAPGMGMGPPNYLMGDSFFGNLDMDSVFGFGGKITSWKYKLLGVREMLACVHAKYLPARACKTDGSRTICPEDWEIRREYVIEADAQRPGYFAASLPPVAKRILYIDSEGWFISASDQYDHEGKLWKTLAIFNTVRDREYPDSKTAPYKFTRLFQTAMVDEDVQTGYSTILYTPTPDGPRHETWFINQGVITQRWIVPQRFTTFRQYFY